MIPSIMCYVSQHVERLGPMTPSFQTRLTPLTSDTSAADIIITLIFFNLKHLID